MSNKEKQKLEFNAENFSNLLLEVDNLNKIINEMNSELDTVTKERDYFKGALSLILTKAKDDMNIAKAFKEKKNDKELWWAGVEINSKEMKQYIEMNFLPIAHKNNVIYIKEETNDKKPTNTVQDSSK